jgi:ABC-type transport system involved in multi-copper enzyme maturation permease subunit
MKALWMRQLGAVLRLELKRTAFSKRGWWIYCLAAGPVLIALLHWLIESKVHNAGHNLGEDSMAFAGMFLLLFLRGSLFFGCMGLFTSLFRGEMLEKTLHYYFLTPVRREVLAGAKYAAGLVVALMLFLPSVGLTYLLIGRHFGAAWSDYLTNGPGMSQFGSYLLVTTLACIGYGSVFLVCGLLFRNPIIPAVSVWVWGALNPFLPGLLKKISVIFYLKSLCPVEVPAPPPFSVMVIDVDPTPAWIAIPGVLAVSAALLIYAAITARQAEINYGE